MNATPLPSLHHSSPPLSPPLLPGDGDGSALDQLNQGLNLLQSVQLPFALVPVRGEGGGERGGGGGLHS